MTIVERWTGREAKLLREALRLSVRDFAARLGVGIRTVNKWEARQTDITPLPHMQEVLDTALARASDEVKARFAAAPRADVPAPETVPRSGPPVRGALLPVVVNGQLVFVPFDADAVATSGLGAVTVESSGLNDTWEVDWMLRRDFSGFVAAFVLGSGIDVLDIDRLAALLGPQPAGSRRIGAADVVAIEQITAAFRGQDFAHGGGLCRDSAVAQLRSVLPLVDAQTSPDVRNRLKVAIADLAKLSGWLSYDIEQHDMARRLWLVALDLARAADDPRATDLTVDVLARMASQALHLRRPDEAQRFAQLGFTISASGSYPVSPPTTSYLASNLAWAHAAQGNAAACHHALDQAVEQFASADLVNVPPWAVVIDETELTAYQGHAHYGLARVGRDPRAAERSVLLLRQAVDSRGPGFARSRGLDIAGLAGAHALAGNVDLAVTLGHQAVDAISVLASPRARERLRTLNTVLEPLHATPSVAELRHRLPAAA